MNRYIAQTKIDIFSVLTVNGVQTRSKWALSGRIEQHRESKDPEPLSVMAREIGNILRDCGVAEEQVTAFCESYGRQFGEDAALSPVNLIDNKRFEITTQDAAVSIEPERSYLVETRVIDGRKYVLIPADEGLEVNGLTIDKI